MENNYSTCKYVYSTKPEKVATPFMALSVSDFCEACNRLEPESVLLWELLIKNKQGYGWLFNESYFGKLMGIDPEVVADSFKELCDKGYLVKDGDSYTCLGRPDSNWGKAEPASNWDEV